MWACGEIFKEDIFRNILSWSCDRYFTSWAVSAAVAFAATFVSCSASG